MFTTERLTYEVTKKLKAFGQDTEALSEVYIDGVLNEARLKVFEKLVAFATRDNRYNTFISHLQINDEPLTLKGNIGDIYKYERPKRYYKNCGEYAYITRDGCQPRMCLLTRVPTYKVRSLLQNEKWNPSFEWSESIWDESQNHFNVYVKDFQILNMYLSYYFYPLEIRRVSAAKEKGETYLDPNTKKPADVDVGLEFESEALLYITIDVFNMLLSANRKDQNGIQREVNKLVNVKNLMI